MADPTRSMALPDASLLTTAKAAPRWRRIIELYNAGHGVATIAAHGYPYNSVRRIIRVAKQRACAVATKPPEK